MLAAEAPGVGQRDARFWAIFCVGALLAEVRRDIFATSNTGHGRRGFLLPVSESREDGKGLMQHHAGLSLDGVGVEQAGDQRVLLVVEQLVAQVGLPRNL